MLIPELIAALAVLAVGSAAVLARAGSAAAARGLVASGLVLGLVGVMLASETEIRFRNCGKSNDRVSAEFYVAHPDALYGVNPPTPKLRSCERWPW